MPFIVQELLKDRRKPVTVNLGDTAEKAIELMMEYEFSQLPVVDHDDRPHGMVTSDSIIRAHSGLNLPLKKLRIRDAMAKKPPVFSPGDDLFEMLEFLMDDNAVLILDGEGRLAGIVTSYDTTEYFRRRAEDIMLVEDIETAIKDHIRSAYTGPEGFDQNAMTVVVKEATRDRGGSRGKFRAAVKKYIARCGNDKLDESAANEAFDAVFTGATATSLDELTLSEYVNVLLYGDKWEPHSKDVFGIDRDALKHMLDGVRKTRNDLMHFRGEIDSNQRNHLRFCMEWLGRHPAAVAAVSATANISVPTAKVPDIACANTTAVADEVERVAAEELGADDSRYTPLALHLQARSEDRVEMTFAQIEAIVGGKLPAYARRHRSWWANDSLSHTQSRQWLEAGWRVVSVNLPSESVQFCRPTERALAYIGFFRVLLEELEQAAPGLSKAGPPNGQNWVTVRTISESGHRAAVLAFTFAHRSRFRVEAYIDAGHRDRNKALFDRLRDHRAELEGMLGEVSWERLDERRASRVAVYQPGSIDDDESRLRELRVWGVRAMVAFNATIAQWLQSTTKPTSQ